MKRKILDFEQLTDNKWINLFWIKGENIKGKIVDWIFCSRKKNPMEDTSTDAVVIVPVIDTVDGKRLVMIKEYRWPINDFEYGFPAGLIEDGLSIEETVSKELKEETGLNLVRITRVSNPIYSSPGFTDESCVIVFVEVDGNISAEYQEATEEIEVLVVNVDEMTQMLEDPSKKIGAKAWGILYYYSQLNYYSKLE